MKLLIRLSILGLAAFGARTLVERLRPRVSGATGAAGNVVGDTITPAFREAASSVRNASTHAVHEVTGAARDAAQEVKDAATGVAQAPSRTTTPTPPAAGEGEGAFGEPAAEDHDHQLSAMATHDLGLDQGTGS